MKVSCAGSPTRDRTVTISERLVRLVRKTDTTDFLSDVSSEKRRQGFRQKESLFRKTTEIRSQYDRSRTSQRGLFLFLLSYKTGFVNLVGLVDSHRVGGWW